VAIAKAAIAANKRVENDFFIVNLLGVNAKPTAVSRVKMILTTLLMLKWARRRQKNCQKCPFETKTPKNVAQIVKINNPTMIQFLISSVP